MKVFVVCQDYNVEGYGEPEFASADRELALAYAAGKVSAQNADRLARGLVGDGFILDDFVITELEVIAK